MIAKLFPPLVAVALASAAYVPSSRAQIVTVPLAAPAPSTDERVVTLDPLEDMLTALEPRAIFTGRVGNLGYVKISAERGYFLRAQPNGQLRISEATGAAITAFAKANGWRI